MDAESWPLQAPQTPALTLSPASSNEEFDVLMPRTPTLEPTEAEVMLLPGFHFSTTDENVNPAEFHRIAAQLLSGEVGRRDSVQYMVGQPNAQHQPQERHLHCDLGRDPSGRHCCSCGKSYSTGLRLYEHTRQCAGNLNFPCMTCDKVFLTKEKRDRHVSTRHNSNREACPECGKMFPASYLPKHLASGLGGCDGMVQVASTPAIDPTYRAPARTSMSQHYWIYDGNHSWLPPRPGSKDSRHHESEEPEVVDRTVDFVKRLLRRPGSRPDRVTCDLCGDDFSSGGDALAQHIGGHSLDFAEKRHPCDDCRIYFANEKDRDRHLQSANLTGHCGFTFHHHGPCTGHHAPTYFKSAVEHDHDLLQKHLWAWELCQLRSHRVTVARVLAETLTEMSPDRHMNLQDCKRTYASLLPHFSMARRRDSVPSRASPTDAAAGGGWMDDHDLAGLDAHFGPVLHELGPGPAAAAAAATHHHRPDSALIAPRPDRPSIARRLSTRASFIDLADKVKAKHGHKRHARSASGLALLRPQPARDREPRPTSMPVGPPARASLLARPIVAV